jgi:hypothetical protein
MSAINGRSLAPDEKQKLLDTFADLLAAVRNAAEGGDDEAADDAVMYAAE